MEARNATGEDVTLTAHGYDFSWVFVLSPDREDVTYMLSYRARPFDDKTGEGVMLGEDQPSKGFFFVVGDHELAAFIEQCTAIREQAATRRREINEEQNGRDD